MRPSARQATGGANDGRERASFSERSGGAIALSLRAVAARELRVKRNWRVAKRIDRPIKSSCRRVGPES
jgi:hypothetical protein